MTIKSRALAYVQMHPGCLNEEVAKHCGIKVESMRTCLWILTNEKKIKRVRLHHGRIQFVQNYAFNVVLPLDGKPITNIVRRRSDEYAKISGLGVPLDEQRLKPKTINGAIVNIGASNIAVGKSTETLLGQAIATSIRQIADLLATEIAEHVEKLLAARILAMVPVTPKAVIEETKMVAEIITEGLSVEPTEPTEPTSDTGRTVADSSETVETVADSSAQEAPLPHVSHKIRRIPAAAIAVEKPIETKKKKKSVVICGLWDQQHRFIRKEFGDCFDITMFNPDERVPRIVSKAKNADYIIVMVSYVRHAFVESIQAEGRTPINVSGSMSMLRRKLTELYVES